MLFRGSDSAADYPMEGGDVELKGDIEASTSAWHVACLSLRPYAPSFEKMLVTDVSLPGGGGVVVDMEAWGGATLNLSLSGAQF